MANDIIKELESLVNESQEAIDRDEAAKAYHLQRVNVLDMKLRQERRRLREWQQALSAALGQASGAQPPVKPGERAKDKPAHKGPPSKQQSIEEELMAQTEEREAAERGPKELPLYAPTYEPALVALQDNPDTLFSPRSLTEYLGYVANDKVIHRFGAALYRLKVDGLAVSPKRSWYRLANPADAVKK